MFNLGKIALGIFDKIIANYIIFIILCICPCCPMAETTSESEGEISELVILSIPHVP